VRKALFATVVAGGLTPFVLVGCASKSNQTFAGNQTSSDWFGVSKLAGLFKSDDGQMSSSDTANPYDPTSLAFEGKPPRADFYVSLADIHEKQNNTVAAEEYYKRALATSSTDLAALVGYAHLLDRQGKFEEATSYYQQAVQHHPTNATAHNDLGLCYARRGMLNESLVALSKAVELDPDKKLYRNNIATVFVEIGQPQHAFEHLSATEQPAVAHYNLACLLQQHGQQQAAAAHFAQAGRLDPALNVAQQMGNGAPAAAHIANVRSAQPAASAGLPHGVATAQVGDMPQRTPYGNAPSTARGQSVAGADRNWAAYDLASSTTAAWPGVAAANAYNSAPNAAGAVPPTPDSIGAYAQPVSGIDTLPPVEQPVPRY
jgi:tetratricopeptide (TPR) repeat protein